VIEEWLGFASVAEGWVLRPHPGATPWRHARHAGLRGRLAGLAVVEAEPQPDHLLLTLVERDFARFGPIVRARWEAFEATLGGGLAPAIAPVEGAAG